MFGLREELYHPLFAHFPIALFTLALLVKTVEVLFIHKENFSRTCNVIFNFLIILAPLSFLLTLFLGDSALDIIKSNFCDLTSANRHEDLAYKTLFLFMGAIFFVAISNIEKIKSRYYLHCQIAILFFLILGNFYLAKTAHLGAMLVYEKGAAVKVAPQKCN